MSAPALPTRAATAFVDGAYDPECAKMESHERARVYVSRSREGGFSVEMRWLGGVVTGEWLVQRMLATEGLAMGGIALIIWSGAEHHSAEIGVSAAERLRQIGDEYAKAVMTGVRRAAA